MQSIKIPPMKSYIILLSFTICFNFLSAHPGIGIVKDSKGNIFYTDLKHIWKISIDGKKTIAVPNVHSHELYMDTADNLFGEHLWFNGERLNTWGHYVWCLKKNGSLVKIKNPSPGFLENYSFVRDHKGNMYWAERSEISHIKKKTPAGTVITWASGKFKDIRWLHASTRGEVYFIDLNNLYKIDEKGKLKLITRSLEESNNISGSNSMKHHVYGIWLDSAENIYIAVRGAQVVKKITPAGFVSAFTYSSGGWSPDAGLFDEKGTLWLKESNTNNETRVRKISKRK